MVWDAVLGGARPLLLLALSIVAYFLGGGLTALPGADARARWSYMP